MKRFVAGLIAAVLLVSCVAFLDGGNIGMRTDGLYYKVSKIHPDATIMAIDGEKISAEEYLYWLAYDCEYLTNMAGQIDWNEVVTGDDITYADFVKDEVTDTMKTYAVLRKMAKEGNVTITDEDTAALDAQRQQYIDYYGGEEGYLQQVQLLGISEETFDSINSMYYLYARVEEAFESGALRPSDEALQSYAADKGMATARLLTIPTADLDDKEIEQRRELAQSYADKLKAADNKDELYAKFAAELGLEVSEKGDMLMRSDSFDEALLDAVDALDEGGVSDAIQGRDCFYVAIRMPLDLTGVAESMFVQRMDDAIANAAVKYNGPVYNKVDVGQFFTDLLQARQELADSFPAVGDANSAD